MSDKPPLTDEQRVINRTRALQMNKGYGWSKAVDRAADTLKKAEQPAQSK